MPKLPLVTIILILLIILIFVILKFIYFTRGFNSLKKVSLLTNQINEKRKIYVKGQGGLGNSLFQIAVAIYYKEKYGGSILLINGDPLKFGTSKKFGRIKNVKSNNADVPYLNTIFNKFDVIDLPDTKYKIIKNDYTNNIYAPKLHENIFIKGYCQNADLFKDYLNKMPIYLNLSDDNVSNYIKTKYPKIENGIMVGLRVGKDFRKMKKITRNSYVKALNKLKSLNITLDNLFIISDVSNAWIDKFDLQHVYPATFIDENDIYQIYAGIMCRHYILSESTFHLWIAYLGTRKRSSHKNVITFNDTDITNRNLSLANWIKIDY